MHFFIELDDVDTTQKRMVEASYMVGAILFILSLSGLSAETTSRKGNFHGICGMTLAIISTFFLREFHNEYMVFSIAFIVGGLIGLALAMYVQMIQMPQMVACLHSFVGIAATVVAFSNYFLERYAMPSLLRDIETYIGIFIGAITFSGSVIAFMKLAGLGGRAFEGPLTIFGSFRHALNVIVLLSVLIFGVFFCMYDLVDVFLYLNCGLSLLLGIHMIMAVAAADMPVIVSMLNSYSGWATAASGFLLNNNLLIITGALVGSSGAILSFIMCVAMNRSFMGVLLGGFGAVVGQKVGERKPHKEVDVKGMADLMMKAKTIIIAPGYGMAQSKAQFIVGELAKYLRKKGKNVRFCIHPVAGRLPGHMNVLLAEARVPYPIVHEMVKINPEFPQTDLSIVIGANDTVNPDAFNEDSPLAGMPVCEVWNAKTSIVCKRGMGGLGFAGIDNPLFYNENNLMFLGDAKGNFTKVMDEIKNREGEQADIKIQVEEVKERKISEESDFEDFEKYPTFVTIGIPKEQFEGERRVAISPTQVKKFIKVGFQIRVESGAGEGCGWTDALYEKCGAEIVSAEQAWESDIVCKIRIPMLNKDLDIHETELAGKAGWLISYIYPAQNKKIYEDLQKHKNLSVFALECIPRITRAQKMDTLSSMTNVAGYRAVIEAFTSYSRYAKGQVTAAGKIDPAKVFVVGVGVAGLASIGTCVGLGAQVTAFDTRKPAREQAESLGAESIDVDVQESGEGGGGYGKVMGPEYQRAQARLFMRTIPESDIVITTALIPGKPAPKLITVQMVRKMRPGSVIVDLAAEAGGNCELTKTGEIVVDEESGVKIIGLIDLHSRMSQQSSDLFGTNLYNLFTEFCGIPLNKDRNAQNLEFNTHDQIVDEALVVQKSKGRWIPFEERMKMMQAKQAAATPTPQAKPEEKKKAAPKPAMKEALIEQDDDDEFVRADSRAGEVKYVKNILTILVAISLVCGMAAGTSYAFMVNFLAFVLAIFIGYMVIWNVTPSLHTPLMSVTNAISGIIVIGAMLQLYGSDGSWEVANILGVSGLFFASINVIGGFVVTQRILNMFFQ